ncbi:MAG: RNA polymerase factor sigma-54 [Muribaculaceae bacterium]|nr:RNA polymerase factor sigma-54 [Muribaculaceae bacterium]
MSEKDSFQQIQKLSQEQIQTQRATLNQMLLGELIEMNDEGIKERIDAELNDNPALEEASEASDNIDDFGDNNDEGDDDTTAEVGQGNDDPFESPYTQNDDDNTADTFDDGFALIASRKKRASDDVYRPPVVNEASMYEVLMNQVHERDLTERQMLIAEYIVGEIDDDGLMRRPITSICGDIISRENEFVSPQEVQEVLEVIQDLEPAGIGATNTRECILLQIEDMKGVDIEAAQLAHAIVDKHFEAYERHHYDKILNALNIDEAAFNEADKIIKRTNPRPGNLFSSGERMANASHITPNFVITTDDNKLQLTVVNDIPELQISESYEIEYQRLAKLKGQNAKMGDEELTIKRQYENASNFIMLLKQRQEKLYKIMKTIMLRQQEFFITGDTQSLKPLVLKDIADETGYDTSTISRAQQNKYVDTNWGIFPVKYFFVKKVNDNDASATAIKEIIKDMVDNEDKTKPLSDDKLCEELQRKGYDIKRRTVAKYRDSMKIPVARQRKTLRTN